MSRTLSIFIALVFFALVSARADTFQLTDGKVMNGVVASADQNGVVLRDGENYSERISWSKFSQDDLKKFRSEPKAAQFVEPFIDEPPPEPSPPMEVKPVQRLDRPAKISLLAAMVSSSVGLTVLLLVYAANVYAGYEISRFRKRPAGLVCAVSAALPVVGPIIFLSMHTVVGESEYVAPEVTASQQQTFSVTTGEPITEPEQAQSGAAGGLHLSQAGPAQAGNAPEAQTYSRGQFMFNRRFFETKFPGFFGVVRRGADKDMVLIFKTARGEYIGQRIARISANELHLQMEQGDASAEVMIPFNDIKEVQLRHQDV